MLNFKRQYSCGGDGDGSLMILVIFSDHDKRFFVFFAVHIFLICSRDACVRGVGEFWFWGVWVSFASCGLGL